MIRRFLVVYSKQDVAFATDMTARLIGEVEHQEIDFAAPLWEDVEDAIKTATDVIVLWSTRTRHSRWAQWEFHLAYLHLLRDTGVALHVVRVDDARVPAYLLPYCHTVTPAPADVVAQKVASTRPGRPLLPPFVGRFSEVALMQRVLGSSRTGIVWIWGIPGIGKSALVGEGLKAVIGDDPTRVRHVNVRLGTRFTELSLLTSTAVGEPPDNYDKTGRDDASIAIRAFASTGGIWVFENAHHWLLADACPNHVLTLVLEWLKQECVDRPGFLAVFTATRKPRLDGWAAGATEISRLEGLPLDEGITLLRANGATADEEILRDAVVQLNGHPLGLKLAAGQAIEKVDWDVKRIRLARDILATLSLNRDEILLLETLAVVDGPLPDEEIAGHLAWEAEHFRGVVGRLVSYNLVQDDIRGFLSIHAVIRDFYIRSFRRRPDRRRLIDDLASRSAETLRLRSPSRPLYVESLQTTFKLLVLAERIGDALALRRDLLGVLYEAAIELYHEERWAEAEQYFREVVAGDPGDLDARGYHARSLARLGRLEEARGLLDDALEEHPNDRQLLRARARIENIAGDPDQARSYSDRALSEGGMSLMELVEVGISAAKQEDWETAQKVLHQAIEHGEQTILAYGFYWRALEKLGDVNQAIEYLNRTLQLDPTDPEVLYDRVRLLERAGKKEAALEAVEAMLRIVPSHGGARHTLDRLVRELRHPRRQS